MALSSSLSHQCNLGNGWVFDPRANLPLRQNSLWKLESGAVRTLTWLEDGTLVILGLWGPGDVVGKALLNVSPFQIECLTQVQAIPFTLTENHHLTGILCSNIQQLAELTVIRSHKRAEFMLINLLSWLGRKFGREVATGKLIDLRLTHQDMADLLGSSRVTITRLLSQLEQQDLIECLGRQQIVLCKAAIWSAEMDVVKIIA
jgi:CRP-like cAMP-binding protein